MAILKHLAVHNKNYHDFITYVLFQHDSHARPVYDENHVMMLQENYLIDAINTTPWTYNLDCQRSNRRWGKNQGERDVRQHHFILSFHLQYWKSQLVPQQQELYERRRKSKQEIKTLEDGYSLLTQLSRQRDNTLHQTEPKR